MFFRDKHRNLWLSAGNSVLIRRVAQLHFDRSSPAVFSFCHSAVCSVLLFVIFIWAVSNSCSRELSGEELKWKSSWILIKNLQHEKHRGLKYKNKQRKGSLKTLSCFLTAGSLCLREFFPFRIKLLETGDAEKLRQNWFHLQAVNSHTSITGLKEHRSINTAGWLVQHIADLQTSWNQLQWSVLTWIILVKMNKTHATVRIHTLLLKTWLKSCSHLLICITQGCPDEVFLLWSYFSFFSCMGFSCH